jgi:hypothetical protein
MDDEAKERRSVEALQGIYRTDGLNLSDDEAKAVLQQMGNRPLYAAISGAVLILGLVAFMVWRFVL